MLSIFAGVPYVTVNVMVDVSIFVYVTGLYAYIKALVQHNSMSFCYFPYLLIRSFHIYKSFVALNLVFYVIKIHFCKIETNWTVETPLKCVFVLIQWFMGLLRYDMSCDTHT